MASDPVVKEHLLSKVKSRLSSSLPFRQGSTSSQGDGSTSSVKQLLAFGALSRSSTTNLLPGAAESKTDHGAGYLPSAEDPSLSTRPRTINIVLFGETGVGKSSVINLIARREVAKVSPDVNGCTMQSTRHNISFDGTDYAIFDTIGLEEPQMGVNGYLKAIEKAYELIVKLSAAGGIHLLLFCMRGGRITATTQSNYRLFCECLCNTKVPIALVFTGLEREVEMEDWWMRNKNHIEHYGIKSDGHACITAVQDDTPGEDLKFAESQMRIRELLKTCALKSEAFLPETYSWFARLGRGMRSFIEKHKNPKKRNIMWVLTHRCKLDPETARKIAEMMEKGDTETKDGTLEEPTGNKEPGAAGRRDEITSAKSRAEPEPGGTDEVTHDVASNRPLPQMDAEAEPPIERKDDSGVMDDRAAKGRPLENPRAEPHPVKPENDNVGTTEDRLAKEHPLEILQNTVKPDPRPVWLEGIPKMGRVLPVIQNVVETDPPPVIPERKDRTDVVDEQVTRDHSPQNTVKTEPPPVGAEGASEVVKGHPPENSQSTIKTDPIVTSEKNIEIEVVYKRVATGYLVESSQNIVDIPPRPTKSEEKDKSGLPKGRTSVNDVELKVRTTEPSNGEISIEKTTNLHTLAIPQDAVDAEPHTAGLDKSGVTNKMAAGRHLGKSRNDVDAEPHPVRPQGTDRRGSTTEKAPAPAVVQKDADTRRRTLGLMGKDNGQSGRAGTAVSVDSQSWLRRGHTQPGHPPISVRPEELQIPGSFPQAA